MPLAYEEVGCEARLHEVHLGRLNEPLPEILEGDEVSDIGELPDVSLEVGTRPITEMFLLYNILAPLYVKRKYYF
jgi:hypothetical protein